LCGATGEQDDGQGGAGDHEVTDAMRFH
jgi:hypothetical protein